MIFKEEHIKKVTKEFCDWVASLGGQSNNIEESTITSLFASGYETKPALSVPIHVVELTNVPPELRMSATVPQQQQQNKNLPSEEKKKTTWVGDCYLHNTWYICTLNLNQKMYIIIWCLKLDHCNFSVSKILPWVLKPLRIVWW